MSSVIRLESLYVQPHIYNLLFNPRRILVNPKIDRTRQDEARKLYRKITAVVRKKRLRRKFKIQYQHHKSCLRELDIILFRGLLDDDVRDEYAFVDFLLLVNRENR